MHALTLTTLTLLTTLTAMKLEPKPPLQGPFPTNPSKTLPNIPDLEMHIYGTDACTDKPSANNGRYRLDLGSTAQGAYMGWKAVPIGKLMPYQIKSYYINQDLRPYEGIDFFDVPEEHWGKHKLIDHSFDNDTLACKVALGTVPSEGKTKGCHTLERPFGCFLVWAGEGHHVREGSLQPPDGEGKPALAQDRWGFH